MVSRRFPCERLFLHVSLHFTNLAVRKPDRLVVAAHDNATGKFKEACSPYNFVKVFANHYLSVNTLDNEVVFSHGFSHHSADFRRTRTDVIKHGDGPYINRNFVYNIEVCGWIRHAGQRGSIKRLKMQHHVYILPIAQYTEMEAAVHRWFYIVKYHTIEHIGDTNLIFGEIRQPTAGL